MSITIKNDLLTVQFRSPDAQPRSERFCCTGMIDQVTLRKRHTFCAPEQLDSFAETCHGGGLCGEFVFDGIARETPPGELFPKPGVGLLYQRPEGGDFDMWKHYEGVPCQASYEIHGASIVFRQTMPTCRFLKLEIQQEYRLWQNTQTQTTTLINRGERAIAAQEYQHNFLRLDGLNIDQHYHLELPFIKEFPNIERAAYRKGDRTHSHIIPNVLSQERHVLGFHMPLDEHEFYLRVDEKDMVRGGFSWKLTSGQTSAWISEQCTFPPSRFDLWGLKHCICPEVYIRFEIEPDRSICWARCWTFGG